MPDPKIPLGMLMVLEAIGQAADATNCQVLLVIRYGDHELPEVAAHNMSPDAARALLRDALKHASDHRPVDLGPEPN